MGNGPLSQFSRICSTLMCILRLLLYGKKFSAKWANARKGALPVIRIYTESILLKSSFKILEATEAGVVRYTFPSFVLYGGPYI